MIIYFHLFHLILKDLMNYCMKSVCTLLGVPVIIQLFMSWAKNYARQEGLSITINVKEAYTSLPQSSESLSQISISDWDRFTPKIRLRGKIRKSVFSFECFNNWYLTPGLNLVAHLNIPIKEWCSTWLLPFLVEEFDELCN